MERLSLLYNIKTPLMYDIVLLDDMNAKSFPKEVRSKTYKCSTLDEETLQMGEHIPVRSIKCVLSGIEYTPNSRSDNSKQHLIMLSNSLGTVFYFSTEGVCTKDGLLINLFNPLTGESIANWLKRLYPESYNLT